MANDKGFWIVFIIYVVMFLVDLFSTLLNWGLIDELEANPLYGFGGLPLIIFVNLLMFMFFIWIYKKDVSNRFMCMYVMTMIILIRIIVIRGNISVFLNPPTAQEIILYAAVAKKAAVRNLFNISVLPWLVGAFTWLFFKMDHIIEKKNG